MKIKFKKLYKNVPTPRYVHQGDAGLDLVAIQSEKVSENGFRQYIEYKTGLCIEIPEGYVGLLFPRSSVSNKNLILGNCIGVVDSNYRGEITFRYKILRDGVLENNIYEVGERVGQIIIMPYPEVEFEEVEELSDTSRGVNGYGSTGK